MDQQQTTANTPRRRRNYAKTTKEFKLGELEFFDDDAESAIPILAALKDLRAADKKIVVAMFKRSTDPALERYRIANRIGIVGESNDTAFGLSDSTPLPGMREDALR